MVELESYSRRIFVLFLATVFFGSILFLQIFNLQIFKHDYYMNKAMSNQQGYTESDPRRGEIFIEDYHSDSNFRVATNTTLDTVFADPSLITDHAGLGDKLAPILFNKDLALRAEELRLKDQRKTLPPELTEEEILDILKPRDLAELKKEFKDEITTKMAQKTRPQILLYREPPDSVREAIRKLDITGIEITDKDVYVYPPKISNTEEIAKKLSPILDIGISRLTNLLEGKNRYVVLASKIEPEASAKIKALIEKDREAMRGIGFEEKSYRFYPEKQLAAQLLGFVDQTSTGVYGIEAYYNDILTGTRGIFKTALDGMGKQITVGDDTLITPAIDGADIYLTIDRSIQLEVERLLKASVDSTRADAGQVLIVDPKTGRYMAMAHYPSFDPNEFWTALDTEEIFLTEEELLKVQTITRGKNEETYLVYDEAKEDKLQLLPVRSEDTGETYYERYKNKVGAAVYRNRAAQDLYEPGSVFKAITMSAAIDDESVTPATTIQDVAPIKVDEFTIDNALGKHYGTITMTQVLETSNNIGMAWISREIGRNLFHSYMMKYGFGKRTDIQLENEKQGYIETFTAWSESELVTHAFGQGISATTIQMVSAFSAFANGGLLMQPSLVSKIEYSDGSVEEIEPSIVRRVISKKTADTLTAMLVSVVDKGQSKTAKIPGYTVAGKTGTSQTYKNGKPLEGAGTTIATFAGFAPANDPRFVILIKLDRPRSSQWADVTALPLFKDVATFLLQYLGIPPDRV
jgi:cell division protein FtsI/penicillin-binding protein 2